MSIKNRIINIAGISLIFMVNLNLAEASEGIDMSGTIVRLISFLLGICGATYLAAGLWQRSEKGSETWKYLSISMIMFVFWNIIGAFGILLDVIAAQRALNENSISVQTLNTYFAIVKVLDPVIEVIVFIILFFGLRKIINTMRNRPWTVFSREDESDD